MKLSRHVRTIISIWLAWMLIMLGFQSLVAHRFQPKRPDYALFWTDGETGPNSLVDRPYLLDPFMNNQVAWDSEYYLSIAATGSYDDPDVPHDPQSGLALNYAFMPFYPLVMRLVAFPLKALGLTPTATVTLAGVIVSAVGTLAAMLALHDLTKDTLGDQGGLRTAIYLIIFPVGFFLTQVYTEGLFVGLSFVSLALIKREKLGLAAALAAMATLTRAVGLALAAPLSLAWLQTMRNGDFSLQSVSWRKLLPVLWVLLPLASYWIWSQSHWGQAIKTMEANFFGRHLFAIDQSKYMWTQAWESLFGSNQQRVVYYGVEFAAILLGLVACIATARHYPGLTAFGFLVLLVSFTSGVAQGMHRYVLAAPSIFVMLSHLGKREVFDRVWTTASMLLIGLMTTMFTFDFWAG